jgi:hypothetical protein
MTDTSTSNPRPSPKSTAATQTPNRPNYTVRGDVPYGTRRLGTADERLHLRPTRLFWHPRTAGGTRRMIPLEIGVDAVGADAVVGVG